MSTHNMFSWRNKKSIMRIPSLISGYDILMTYEMYNVGPSLTKLWSIYGVIEY